MAHSDKSPSTILLIAKRPGLRELLGELPIVLPEEARHCDEVGRARIAVALLSSLNTFTAEDMALYPNLRLIATIGAGAERIDTDAAQRRGIRVATGAGANAEDVADMATILFLALARRIVAGDARVRDGEWIGLKLHLVPSLSSYRVGIMGMGAIGKAIARRLETFRCALAWTGPHPKPDSGYRYFTDLETLAEWANALVIAAPLNANTNGAVGRDVIDRLGPNALIVNVGRGGIVDEAELISALREGRLAGAGLDVFSEEPTPPEKWRDVPNILLSPHSASATPEALDNVVAQAVRHVTDFLCERSAVSETTGFATEADDAIRPLR